MGEAPDRILVRVDYDGDVDGQWIDADAPRPHSFGHYFTEYVPATTLEVAQARVRELEAEAERRDEQIQTMIGDSGQECACGYDRTSDVCLGHLHHHRASVATARDEALEEAAKVAESPGTPIFHGHWTDGQVASAITAMSKVAAAIRALKEKPNG